MRFMAMIKATRDYETGQPPNPKLMAEMGKLSAEKYALENFTRMRELTDLSSKVDVAKAGYEQAILQAAS